MGQNMVGRVRIRGTAPEGTTVTLRFAEVLDEDGNLYTANLRGARVTDYYTFKGDDVEDVGTKVHLPRLPLCGDCSTIRGNWQPTQSPELCCTRTWNRRVQFTVSAPLLNQLQHNILWGQKGNFVDVPTDCPQRDERLGWTGDIQVFLQTAAFNMDVAGFMTKWMQDLADAQSERGEVPAVVPKAIVGAAGRRSGLGGRGRHLPVDPLLVLRRHRGFWSRTTT